MTADQLSFPALTRAPKSGLDLAEESLAVAVSRHPEETRLLAQVAVRLIHSRPDHRITQDDVRIEGARLGIIPAKGSGRQLSFLPGWTKVAGCVAVGRCRSVIPGCHGNHRVIWTLPQYVEAR